MSSDKGPILNWIAIGGAVVYILPKDVNQTRITTKYGYVSVGGGTVVYEAIGIILGHSAELVDIIVATLD